MLRISILLMATALAAGCSTTPSTVTTGGIEAVGLARAHNIRVVYQIKTNEQKNGVGAGLYYVKKLLDTYNEVGIPDGMADIHAVLHGDAGYWLLDNSAYTAASGRNDTNPNKPIIEELTARGVSIELCAQTMRSKGWAATDVLPEVTIVVGAYPRIIDLQQRGYAYIRF